MLLNFSKTSTEKHTHTNAQTRVRAHTRTHTQYTCTKTVHKGHQIADITFLKKTLQNCKKVDLLSDVEIYHYFFCLF